jgi:hypothetical protein
VQTQPTQIISDPSRGELARLYSQQWSKMLADVVVTECALDGKEQEQNLQKGLNAWIGEAQRRCTLVADNRWLLHVLERGFTDEAIVADALDVEQTSVGRKADLAQLGKIFHASADTKVTRIVDGRCVRSASSSLWYCLIRDLL